MKCKLCNNQITIEVRDLGTTQSEYDYEVGHKEGCGKKFFDVKKYLEDNRTWTEEEEAEHRRLKGREFLERRNIWIKT